MFPRASLAILGVLVISLVVVFLVGPVRFVGATRAQMRVGRTNMKSLKEIDVPPWIERTNRLLAEWTPNLDPIGAYGLGGKPVPAELQQLGIIRIDILQYQVRYVWMGGMDHTEREIDRLEDGSFRIIAHYNDFESEVIWPERPNQSMRPTASRRAIQLCMSSTRQPDALRALARGNSS
jgi:hypothetical protein